MTDSKTTRSRTLTRDAEALPPGETETATFGMGCFWGPDARFGAMDGVVRTRVGYAGGTKQDPSYYALGDHTEVVQVEYDPDVLTYGDLLETFWTNHSPTTATKRQYRSVILAGDDSQRAAAERSLEEFTERLGSSASVETAIEDLGRFYLAEDYHQKYELRSTPVVGDELADLLGDEFVDSTVATRLNGFVAGHGDPERRRAFLANLELPPEVLSEVRRRI